MNPELKADVDKLLDLFLQSEGRIARNAINSRRQRIYDAAEAVMHKTYEDAWKYREACK